MNGLIPIGGGVVVMDWSDEVEAPRLGWFGRLHLSWPVLLVAGWLLYEITASPGLAALVACAKFGWSDVRIAFWLRAADPDARRGRACFWSYLTYGLWKVAMLATLSMVVMGFLGIILLPAPPQQPAIQKVSPVFWGALSASVIGFGLSFLTGYVALWSACRRGLRIWLGKAPRRARREGFWPPDDKGINMFPFVGMTTAIMTLGFLSSIAAVLCEALQPRVVHPLTPALIVLALLTVVVGGGIRVGSLVYARSPRDCWGAVEGEVYQARVAEEGVARP